MSANFTPSLEGYSGVKPFRFWCQKTLPLVYDDSLSYYELLNKVVYYVNNLINDTSTAENNIGKLLEAYNNLQDYVNTYFNNLDVQNEIDTKLDSMAVSGELSNLIFPFIEQNNPTIVNSREEMTDTNHIYVLAPSGFIYTYKNGSWTNSNIVYGISENNYISRTNSDINEAVDVGSYRIKSSSLSQLNLLLPEGRTYDKYYWICFVIKPSTANNNDVTQILIGNHQGYTETVIFTRTSVNGAFNRNFVRIFPLNFDEYRTKLFATNYATTNIENALGAGSYRINQESLSGLNLDLPKGEKRTYDKYYWTCFVIKPSTTDNRDVTQILIGNHQGYNETVIFTRTSVNGTFNRNFVRISPFIFDDYRTKLFATNYAATNIENALDAGSYRINQESLSGLNLDLPEGEKRTYDKYYWTCFVVKPATANNIDVIQFLIGNHQGFSETVIFTRTRIGGVFNRNFVRIFPTAIKTSGSITKVCFCGDSFTATRPNATSFVDFLNPVNKQFINLAISGATPDSWYEAHANDIKADYNTYFVAFGLNGSTDGDLNSTDVTTFCGGMMQLITKIQEVAPTARIIIWCMDAWFTKARSDLAEQIAERYGCEFYSMKASKEIPVRIDGKFDGVMPTMKGSVWTAKTNAYAMSANDHHPNTAAQKMLATYLDTIL